MSEYLEKAAPSNKNSVLAIFGAAVGALLGALAWAAVSALGYTPALLLVGLAIAWLAASAYDMLGGKQGKVKIITLIVCAIWTAATGTMIALSVKKAKGQPKKGTAAEKRAPPLAADDQAAENGREGQAQ